MRPREKFKKEKEISYIQKAEESQDQLCTPPFMVQKNRELCQSWVCRPGCENFRKFMLCHILLFTFSASLLLWLWLVCNRPTRECSAILSSYSSLLFFACFQGFFDRVIINLLATNWEIRSTAVVCWLILQLFFFSPAAFQPHSSALLTPYCVILFYYLVNVPALVLSLHQRVLRSCNENHFHHAWFSLEKVSSSAVHCCKYW